jgi:hypothetical protein
MFALSCGLRWRRLFPAARGVFCRLVPELCNGNSGLFVFLIFCVECG